MERTPIDSHKNQMPFVHTGSLIQWQPNLPIPPAFAPRKDSLFIDSRNINYRKATYGFAINNQLLSFSTYSTDFVIKGQLINVWA